MRPDLKTLCFIMLLAASTWHSTVTLAAQAANLWQDHAAIRATAQRFLDTFTHNQHQERSQVKLGHLDSRLRLKSCHAPLDAFMPAGGHSMGNTTVGIRCPDKGGWNIYLTARIDVFGPVLVTRQPLVRGTRIRASDLKRVERNLSNLPYGYYTDPQAVIGQLAKRTITGTTVITPTLLQAPKWVKRGERVSVIAESGVLKIRTVGKALSDGQSGDLVRVRAAGSNRIINGIVISEGVIKVTL